MNILYLSCYPDVSFKKIVESGRIISQAAQKFNKLLVKGACLNSCDVEVAVIYNKSDSVEEVESEFYGTQKIKYHYCPIEGNIVNRTFQKKKFAKQIVSDFAKNNPEGIVIIDSLSPLSYEFSKNAKHNNITIVTHITDFKDFLLSKSKNCFKTIKRIMLLSKYYNQFKFTDVFLFLTEPMIEKVKLDSRKYLIMDGVCDFELFSLDNNVSHSINNKKTFLYSGALSKQFGLHNLINGFITANCTGSELHLYGTGDYVDELKKICEYNPTVKYFGIITNEEMLIKQREATFLVNPRPVDDEYTKYSFPSKNIEYMTSGRPIITTKLPCITEDYNPFVYYFEDDSIEGIKNTIKMCCELHDNELLEKGNKARKYILNNKNNKIQIKRVLELVKELKS